MRIMIVVDHPYTCDSADNVPHHRSFTAAVAAAAVRGAQSAGHQVDLADLTADRFDPVMSGDDLVAWRLGRPAADSLVVSYQHRLLLADHLVFAFPIWWEAMPARTKGFLDRVIVKGMHYDEIPGGRGNPFRSLMVHLQGVTALTVMSTPRVAYRWWFGDPVTKILFKGTFAKIGVKHLRWRNYACVDAKSAQERDRLLADTTVYFRELQEKALPASTSAG